MEEEILEEIEAMRAVYGGDCKVLRESPPHLAVSIKPRTAEDISQQFVEAVLIIKANAKYPSEPPELELSETKGLDDSRHSALISELRVLSNEYASSPMLVALSEAAIDKLSDMNHPDGDCSFCLFPLAAEGERGCSRPLMKLMSCFHCFHSDCFQSWWQWLEQKNVNLSDKEVAENESGSYISRLTAKGNERKFTVHCPVCRSEIHSKDVEHAQLCLNSDVTTKANDGGSIVDYNFLSKDEIERREKFAEMLKTQKERGGIIEPRKVILPGMFLPISPTSEEPEHENKESCSVEDKAKDQMPDRKSTDIDSSMASSSKNVTHASNNCNSGGQYAANGRDNSGGQYAANGRDGNYNRRGGKYKSRNPHNQQQLHEPSGFSKPNNKSFQPGKSWVKCGIIEPRKEILPGMFLPVSPTSEEPEHDNKESCSIEDKAKEQMPDKKSTHIDSSVASSSKKIDSSVASSSKKIDSSVASSSKNVTLASNNCNSGGQYAANGRDNSDGQYAANVRDGNYNRRGGKYKSRNSHNQQQLHEPRGFSKPNNKSFQPGKSWVKKA